MGNNMETLKPITLTMQDGTVYTLDFNRESVKFAESRGFKIDELFVYPMNNIPLFWFLAFRMHHKNVPRSKTDQILEQMHGLSKEVLERLHQLYNNSYDTLINLDEQPETNPQVTVEL